MPLEIIESPSPDCNPSSGCVRWCVTSDDYIVEQGTVAQIQLNFNNWTPPQVDETITLFGFTFTASDITTPNTFDVVTSQDPFDVGVQINMMLQMNIDFICKFQSVPGQIVTIWQAIETGIACNGDFFFDEPNSTYTPGTETTYRNCYQIKYKLFKKDDEGNMSVIKNAEAITTINPSGVAYLNIGKLAEKCLSKELPSLSEFVAVCEDAKINVCAVFGDYELSESGSLVQLNSYQTDAIEVIHTRTPLHFDFSPYCFFENFFDTKWLTRRPQNLGLCQNAYQWQAVCLPQLLIEFFQSLGGEIYAIYEFDLVDGSSVAAAQLIAEGGVVQIQSGLPQICGLIPMNSEIISWSVGIELVLGQFVLGVIAPQEYVLKKCCEKDSDNVNIIFCNCFNKWDTISFEKQPATQISFQSGTVCCVVTCDNKNSGARQRNSIDVERAYSALSLELDCYGGEEKEQAISWIQEFASSPEHYVVENGEFVPIILQNGEITIVENNDKLRFGINYVYANQERK